MTADALTARDDVMALLAPAIAALGGDVVVRWQGVGSNEPPEGGKRWLRVTMNHADGRQASLAGATPVKRWNRTGLVMVQCFAPLAKGSIKEAIKMATAVQNALQGKATPNCVWFRNAQINEVGPDKFWYQVNMTAIFDYDEAR